MQGFGNAPLYSTLGGWWSGANQLYWRSAVDRGAYLGGEKGGCEEEREELGICFAEGCYSVEGDEW